MNDTDDLVPALQASIDLVKARRAPFDTATKLKILADLGEAISRVLEPTCRHGVDRSAAKCDWCSDYEAQLEGEAYDQQLAGPGRVYGP